MVLLKKLVTTIKNDYVTKAALTNQINDLKNQHIS